MFDLTDLEQARQVVYAAMPPTPQYCWPLLRERAGCEVWVKHENHTPTGAFKARGSLYYLHQLRQERPDLRRLVTATRGNHGQGLAFAARRTGHELTVVVPRGNSVEKNSAMRAFGAHLIEHGRDFDESREFAARLAAEQGAGMIPSFHPWLVTGVATYARELFDAVPDLDTVYVPIGLGSGICGLIRARDLLGLRTRIVGVVAAGAPAYALSLAAGQVIPTDRAETIADGVAVRVPSPEAFAVIQAGAERIVRVNEEKIEDAVRALFSDTHNVAEGAGALALAALLQEREAMRGRRVAMIQTGGNIDRDRCARILGAA